MTTFVTVNFNTTLLISCLCLTLRKFHPDCNIVVFDNSNRLPLPKSVIQLFDIIYLDNTKEKYINFDTEFSKLNLPRDNKCEYINNLGSAKHCYTIDYLLYTLPYDNIILLDSDILLKKPIDFDNTKYITAGTVNNKEVLYRPTRAPRILPYAQFFNLKLIKHYGLHYFHPNFILGFYENARNYDTGSYFYLESECRFHSLCNFNVNIDDYIVHYKGASWCQTHSVKDWLFKYQYLWGG